ncbi:insulin receptor substrate 1 chico isoform X2 [Rhodnius prolixus]|uniref:insulin receptor substrate 1 chico isoform X2 n=1 Tax=Rhodnius prolixus TaxID=13249 RepID=UPI003D187A68
MTSRNSAVKVSSRDIVKQGYLKKLKTMKKKYFVLRRDSAEVPARLEYYDSEKKFKANLAPKRSITLKTCFNINKPSDTRQKYVIALFTKKDRFCVVFDNEDEMEDWLKVLLELQHEGNLPAGEPARPNFEQVWQVTVLSKELGQRANILGPHRLCLTDQTLSLVKLSTTHPDQVDAIKFSLQKIRRCGHVDSFFYMEVGQCTVTGAGNLWMQTEDNNIAENMHAIILKACGNCTKKDLQPKSRNRSSSANEASKPVSLMQRWPTHTVSSGSGSGGGSGPVNHQRTYSFPLSPVPPTRRASTGTRPSKCITSTSPQSSLTGVRERSDSMPSRARTTSECAPSHMHPPRYVTTSQYRPHSMYNRGVSYSPPVGSSPVSPASAACSTDSAGSSLSMDGDSTDCPWEDQGRYGHSLTPDEPVILEENPDDYSPWIGEDEKLNNYMPMDTNYCLPIQSNPSFNSSVYRKYSPNPSSSGFKSSSPSQASFMEMYSPCGSSPMDTPGNYLPMSPGENRLQNYTKNVGNHSRGSSLAEDGYVPMAPGASDDGYVDMDHGPRRNKQERYQSGDLSTGSSCSITSGTPSNDFRFNEYPSDKVPYYFTHEEDITPAERPARAYSVGSRPTYNNNRSEIASSSAERTRAFSVGSKNVRVANPMRMVMHNHNPATHASSHSSMEPSDDMMELDFSKKGRMKSCKKPSSSERLSVPVGSASTLSSLASSYSTAEGSYMDMSLPCSSNSASVAPSPPKPSRFAALLGKSPPKPSLQEVHALNKSSPPVSGYPSPSLGRVPETEPGYVEMTIKSDSQSTTPSDHCLCMTHSESKDDAYVEMKPGQIEVKQIIATNAKARIDSFPPTNNQKMQGRPPSPSDYVVMDLGGKSPSNNCNESKQDSSNQNYMNMSYKKEDKKKTRRDARYSSQPITIQSSTKDSPNLVYTRAGRKHSTGTPPKVPSFLPLGRTGSPLSSPYSSLSRSKYKEGVRKDNNTGPCSFVVHSPSELMDCYEQSPKVPIDGTSGTLKISYSETNLMEKRSEAKIIQESSDYVDYQPCTCSSTSNDTSVDDYVPMAPAATSSSKKPSRKTSAPSLGARIRPIEKLLSGLGNSFSTLSISSTPIVTLPPSPVKSESETLVGDDAMGYSDDEGEGTASKSGNSDSSRKSSVASVGNKEIHYASLDLVVRSGGSIDGEELSRNLTTQTSLSETSSTSIPSPNLSAVDTTFNYAEIDFAKSGSSTQKTIH